VAAKAIAIDPGSSTGVAILTERDEIVTMTLDTSEGDVAGVLELLLEQRPSTVIVERFVTSGLMSRYGLHTVELVGAIKALSHLAGSTELYLEHIHGKIPAFDLVLRTPSQRAVRIPTAKVMLRERRTTLGHKFTDHEVDALAHLIGWMRSQEGDSTIDYMPLVEKR
jgi:hypothetical protein